MKDYFIEQLSMLLASGMPVVVALAAIKKEIKSKILKEVIETLSANIEAGSSISKALEEAKFFSPSIISLIKIGEQSGRLVENLKVIANQQQKEREFNSKIASAMMYPIFVFSLTLIVGLGVAWFILPRLATVFAQMRIELPLLTRWLIAIGTFLGQYGLIVIPAVLVVLSLIVYFVFFFSKTKFIGQELLFLFPPLAQLLMGLELSRFGYLLGNLLEAGLPILDSLDSLAGSTTLNRYKKFYLFLHDRMAEGNSFGKSFEMYSGAQNLIPSSVQQLIIVGEQSGNLATTLQKIGSLYEDKTDITTKNISVLLDQFFW